MPRIAPLTSSDLAARTESRRCSLSRHRRPDPTPSMRSSRAPRTAARAHQRTRSLRSAPAAPATGRHARDTPPFMPRRTLLAVLLALAVAAPAHAAGTRPGDRGRLDRHARRPAVRDLARRDRASRGRSRRRCRPARRSCSPCPAARRAPTPPICSTSSAARARLLPPLRRAARHRRGGVLRRRDLARRPPGMGLGGGQDVVHAYTRRLDAARDRDDPGAELPRRAWRTGARRAATGCTSPTTSTAARATRTRRADGHGDRPRDERVDERDRPGRGRAAARRDVRAQRRARRT